MPKYELSYGVQQKALRVVLYGPEGIGKTTLAAEFPSPIFIDVEDGSNQLPVTRMPRPTSWDMLIDEIREIRAGNVPCSTLVLDTADAAEGLCIDAICAEKSWKGIEDAGYGKGYTYLAEKYGKLLDLLGEVVDSGRNVVIVSHSFCRKFERPDEEGAYDRYELKLSRKVAPMVKEWCDLLLFLDYKTLVETDNNGHAKAKGGKRVIRTTHHPCWDAKNRVGMPDQMALSYDGLAPYIPDMMAQGRTIDHAPVIEAPKPAYTPSKELQRVDEHLERMEAEVAKVMTPKPMPKLEDDPRDSYPADCKQLVDLMKANDVTDEELRRIISAKGYRPYECTVAEYPEGFVPWLVSLWPQIMSAINEMRQTQA